MKPTQSPSENPASPPLGPTACSAEVVHGYMLPPGQDASAMPWWAEFAEFFERKEGFRPHPRDSGHKRLFEYYVEGAWHENQMGQNDRNSAAGHQTT